MSSHGGWVGYHVPFFQARSFTLGVIPNSRACWVSISGAGSGTRGLAALKIWNVALEPWNLGTLEPGTPEPSNPGTLEPLNFWNPGTPERLNLATLDAGNLER